MFNDKDITILIKLFLHFHIQYHHQLNNLTFEFIFLQNLKSFLLNF